jgi:hypothetical protein
MLSWCVDESAQYISKEGQGNSLNRASLLAERDPKPSQKVSQSHLRAI